MRKMSCVSVLLLVFALSSNILAATQTWVGMTGPSTWYYSPVTDGYADLRLFVQEATFTDAVFTFNYDSQIIDTIISTDVLNIIPGLELVTVTNEDIGGTWKKATITLTGNLYIGFVQYQSEAIFQLHLRSIGEGMVPVTLWPADRYPESYNTCSLVLMNGTEQVAHERKEWSDGTELFAFTDKTEATLLYYYDMNFGTPIGGSLTVLYSDNTQEVFYTSDHAKGIMIDAANGAFFITPQPGATAYTLNLTNYGDQGVSLMGGRYISHIQPEGHFFVLEDMQGFHSIKAQPTDIQLTLQSYEGIGVDFASSTYTAAMAGDRLGILDKNFSFTYIDDNTIRVTIEGGLEPDYYNLYLYKNGEILGRAWFNAAIYYPVTFSVSDENENPLEGAMVRFVMWGMMGLSTLDEFTDENGDAVVELPGDAEWGAYHEYKAVLAGYQAVSDAAIVYDAPTTVPVVMLPAPGVSLTELATFATQWQKTDCSWNSDCNGADLNFDNTVNSDDLILFVSNWLKEI